LVGLVVLIVLAALAAVAPTSADAFGVSHFVAARHGGSVFWNFNVCGARGYRMTFQAALEADSGSPTYHRTWHARQRFRCTEWQLEAEDIWTEVLWDTQLTVFARGQLVRTPVVVFDNSEG
jgi:hypothetical protein